MGERPRRKRTVRFRTSFSNTIYDVMCSRGWKETDSETDWDLHWAERDWVYEARFLIFRARARSVLPVPGGPSNTI